MVRKITISAGVAFVVFAALFAVWLSWDDESEQPVDPTPVVTDPVTDPGREIGPSQPANTDPGSKPKTPRVLEPRSPARYEGVVAGRVVAAETLAPIAGAQILIADDAPETFLDRTMWLDVVKSNDKGLFAFKGLRPAVYRLQASASGRLDAVKSGVAVGLEVVEIRLKESQDISCRLMASTPDDDEPLAGASVYFEHPGSGWTLETRSDASGLLFISGIEAGTLKAEFGHIEVIVAGWADPFLRPAGPDEDTEFVIHVDPGATVVGTVTDKATGKPIEGATIVSDYGHEERTDANGSFRISGVEDGLTAVAPGYAPKTKELDIFDDGAEVKVDFKLNSGVVLYGFVKSSGGAPVPGVRVKVSEDALDLDIDEDRMNVRLQSMLSSVTDAKGGYRIEGLPADALDLPGEFELEIRPEGSGKGTIEDVEIEVVRGEVRKDFVLDLQPIIRGTVRRADGQAVAGARVSTESVDDENYQVTSTDAEGRFTLRDLPVGDYDLGIEVDGAPAHVSRYRVPFEGSLDVEIAPGRTLRGVVVSERDGAPLANMTVRVVFLRGMLSLMSETRTDAEGVFEFQGVPAGERLLEIRRAPPQYAFHPDVAFHRVDVDLTEDWAGEIEYPSNPSGEVAFHFSIKSASSPARRIEDPVDVEVTYYQRGRFRVGNPSGARRGFKVGEGRGTYQGRFREGNYSFRCVLDRDGRKIVQDVKALISDGSLVERDVIFVE